MPLMIKKNTSVRCLDCNAEVSAKLLRLMITVKILKFGTPQTMAIIVLKIEMFLVTLH